MLNPNIWLGLISNASWLLALFIIYDMGHRFFSMERRWSFVFDGFLISVICMAVMILPYPVETGIFYDSRSILISVTGLFFGPVTAAIVIGASGIFRVILGGPGVYAGVFSIITCGLIGVIWYYWIQKNNRKITIWNLYGMGVFAHLAVIGGMQLLPEAQGHGAIDLAGKPILILYPIFTVILGLLLRQQQEKKQFFDEMKASEEKYRSLMENVSDVVWTTDLNLKITYVSPSVEKLFGVTDEIYRSKSIEEKYPLHAVGMLKELLLEELQRDKDPEADRDRSREVEAEHFKADGSILWTGMKISFLRDDQGKPIGLQGVTRDIHRRKKSEEDFLESQRSREVLLDNLPGMAYRCRYDKDWTMDFVSRGCFELTGYQPESLLHNQEITFNEMILPQYHSHLWNQWEIVLKNRGKLQEEYEIRTAQGQIKWVFEQGQGVFDDDGKVVALEGLIIDISEQKQNEMKIRHLYNHNDLTNIPNLRSFNTLFPEILSQSPGGTPGVLMVNLRRFSVYNRIFGYWEGNQLIRKVGSCLEQYASPQCLLFHISIDRFVYFFPTKGSRDEMEAFGKKLMEHLIECIDQQAVCFNLGLLELETPGESTTETILRRAAVAGDQVSSHQRIGMEIFSPDMERKEEREKLIRQGLSLAVEDAQDTSLFIMVQPIVSIDGTKIKGFEALARYQHPELGLISPGEFIPLAETSQLMIPLGYRIIRMAGEFAHLLEREGFGDIPVSFNVSAIQLLTEGFLPDLEALLKEMNIPSRRFHMEITESIFSDNYQLINESLEKIRSFGMKTAIDDFGTGYSSLSREDELQADSLKIDKFFMDKLMSENPERSIVEDIISMAHKLGQKVVAEGVESEIQRQYLEEHRCDYFQGYLFSRPLLAADAIEMLNEAK